MLFAGSLQPLTELLNSWLLEGVLDDPFGEVHFLIEAESIIYGKNTEAPLFFNFFKCSRVFLFLSPFQEFTTGNWGSNKNLRTFGEMKKNSAYFSFSLYRK